MMSSGTNGMVTAGAALAAGAPSRVSRATTKPSAPRRAIGRGTRGNPDRDIDDGALSIDRRSPVAPAMRNLGVHNDSPAAQHADRDRTASAPPHPPQAAGATFRRRRIADRVVRGPVPGRDDGAADRR